MLSAVIMEVQLNYTINFAIQSVYKLFASNRFPTEAEITRLVQSKVYIPLQTYMFSLINLLVPRDSARLRNAFEISIRDHSHTGNMNPFVVVMDSGEVAYAAYANEMPDTWLKHPGSHSPYSPRTNKGRKKTPKFLSDPNAKHHFFQDIVEQSQRQAETLFKLFIQFFASTYLAQHSLFYKTTLARQIGFMDEKALTEALFFPRRFI